MGTRVDAVNKRKKQLHAQQLNKIKSVEDEQEEIPDHEIKLDPEVSGGLILVT